jgi:hypothetical protein
MKKSNVKAQMSNQVQSSKFEIKVKAEIEVKV